MATVAAPTQQAKRRRRVVRWCLVGLLVLVLGSIVFAWEWPLALLLGATQVRLRFDGIHSDYVTFSYGSVGTVRVHYYVADRGRRWCWCMGWEGAQRTGRVLCLNLSAITIAYTRSICRGMDGRTGRGTLSIRYLKWPVPSKPSWTASKYHAPMSADGRWAGGSLCAWRLMSRSAFDA